MDKQEWILVKDNFPEVSKFKSFKKDKRSDWVLCAMVGGDPWYGVLNMLHFYDHKTKTWHNGYDPYPEDRITHWMYIPEPPVRAKNAHT